jgi:acyl carrier protein
MTIEKFISELKMALEIENENINLATILTSLNGYDSMSILTLIVLIDENFNIRLTSNQFNNLTTIESLINLIGIDKFEL